MQWPSLHSLGGMLSDGGLVLGAGLGTWVVMWLLARSVYRWRGSAFQPVIRPLRWVAVILVMRYAGGLSDLAGYMAKLTPGVMVAVNIGVAVAVYRLLQWMHPIAIRRAQRVQNAQMATYLIDTGSRLARLGVFVWVIVYALHALGYNVTSILAGLGLGGFAVALAAKDTFSNMFGSVNIVVDQPFSVGDYIVVDGTEGVVEHLGMRSTRIRTLEDSLVTVPNATVTNTKIDNRGKRNHRRVKQVLGVTYGTSRDHLQAFVEQVRAYLETVPVIRAEHTHVRFYGFGESSLDIYVSYFLTVGGWADELQWREVINYEIMAIAQRVGVSFAFPSRSVYVETLPAT